MGRAALSVWTTLVIVFLLGPLVIIVAGSFTEAPHITFPPEGFTLTNTPQQVIAAHPGGARMILDGDARWSGAMSRYIADRWLPALRQSGVIAEIDEIRDITVSGLDAATTVFPCPGSRACAAP